MSVKRVNSRATKLLVHMKHQSSALLALSDRNPSWQVDFQHKMPVIRRGFHGITSPLYIQYRCCMKKNKAYLWWHLIISWLSQIIGMIITMTSQWALWLLKSPPCWVFAQPFVQTHIKENIKALHHWPLCGDLTGDRWIPRTNGQ